MSPRLSTYEPDPPRPPTPIGPDEPLRQLLHTLGYRFRSSSVICGPSRAPDFAELSYHIPPDRAIMRRLLGTDKYEIIHAEQVAQRLLHGKEHSWPKMTVHARWSGTHLEHVVVDDPDTGWRPPSMPWDEWYGWLTAAIHNEVHQLAPDLLRAIARQYHLNETFSNGGSQ